MTVCAPVSTQYKSPRPITDVTERARLTYQLASQARLNGFPHFEMSETDLLLEFSALQRFNRSGLIQGNIIGQAQQALGACWYYFPHHWAVKVGRRTSVWEAWHDDSKLEQAISKALQQGRYGVDNGNPFLSPAKLRQAISFISGVQRVSNFRPTAAAAIYDRYANGTVWDMSCGYGGRLIGAIASSKVQTYIGTEPHDLTYVGLRRMAGDMAHLTKTDVRLHCVGSEDFQPERGSVSLCFTSPPYFKTERYADDLSQSYVKFPSIAEWNDGFLAATIEKARQALRQDGILILNVANTEYHPTLETDTVRIAHSLGFALDHTLQLTLSRLAGGHKSEPAFVFKTCRGLS